jgi:hypothetical protein
MPFHTVRLPGPVVLVPGKSLESQVRRQTRDHPRLPPGLPQLAFDLNNRSDGVPTTFDEPRNGGDPSLLLHGESYVARLFLTRKRDAYTIGAINPLRIRDHHRVAHGCLLVRPTAWQPVYEYREIPQGSDAYWSKLTKEWERLGARSAEETGAPPLTGPQSAFLDTVGKLIDATEEITTNGARSTRPFPYGAVTATGGERYGTRAVYEFRLVTGRRPEERAFVQVRGEPEQRGQVTRVADSSVTVRFDQPVDWARIPQQGELEITLSSIVYAKQREAVALLRARQSRSPGLMPALVEHQVRGIQPASDSPTEQLDDDQLEAFRKALAVNDMLLVLGPPGTGKTRTISQIAGGVAASGRDGPVLITSHTNRAVDNVLPRLPRGLCVVRVGNDGRVTEEGRPFLLERQATDMREEILGSTGPRKDTYAGVDVALRWAQELDNRLDKLQALVHSESQLRAEWAAARRSAGGEAQTRVDELESTHQRLARSLARNGRRITRLNGTRESIRRGAHWWVIGALLGLLVQLCDRRLRKAWEGAQQLLAQKAEVRAEMDRAEQELEARTRDVPEVLAARTALDRAGRLSGECRAEAFTAAHACRAALPPSERPPALRGTADPVAADQDLTAVRTWLAERLPLIAARANLLAEWHAEVSGESEQLYPELIRYAHVIAATSIGVASRPELSSVEFELAIVDEAGQIGMADVLVPLVRARRAVLVGDHQQLPPFLDSEVEAWGRRDTDPTVLDLLTKSALETLVHALPATHVVPLTVQRRMPSAIADFASAMFYEGRLRTGVVREHRDPLFRSPLAFVDTARLPERERQEKAGGSDERWGQRGYTNPAEARLLIRLALLYHRRGGEWAVIVPYRAQAGAISDELIRLTGEPETIGLNVGTVDSFQGGERDVILYGFTRSNANGSVGFLKELRRVNVALTRAKNQLVLVGDMNTLTSARDRRFRDLSVALRAHLAVHGDIRQYQEIHERLADLDNEGTDA